ncbi:MAG TPA: transcriptional regulator, partial [Polyangia bacterium]
MSRGSPPRNDARVEGSPAEALATARDRLRGLLVEGPQTARSLSEAAGLPEKDVLHHLGHLARSAPARAER